MVKIFIDDIGLQVKEGATVLNAAQQAGIFIPHLCYHPAFIPEGSCRLCLVEIEGMPKLELACATVVREGMKIATQNERVRSARQSVLEFLLAEHPLDCPICDKAGECKLQDYYDEYGLFESAFRELKEKKEKKILIGRRLLLDRERCILCTRCVRFLAGITKTRELGVFERGIHSEIGTLEEALVDNNYSGNLAELCPVGAITDTDFRFKTRSWFLVKGESICPLCSRGCNIYVEHHPGFPRLPETKKVYRIRARENLDVNDHWICDIGRYNTAYLEKNRCEKFVMNKEEGETILTWEKILGALTEKIRTLHFMKKTSRIGLVLTSLLSNEELFLIKKLFLDDLKLEKVFFADPKPGTSDGFLLQAEHSPNRKGAIEIGFDLKEVRLEALAHETDLLLIFGPFLTDTFRLTDLHLVLDQIGSKFLFTSHLSGLESVVDFVCPTALITEKSGSLTNTKGIIQRFSAALDPRSESRPEWEMLASLAKELKINFRYYQRFSNPEAVFQALQREIPFFSETND
ncbi:MAG: 2Fe-2S iron-sulfur cluster-binding protein [Candidatus Aminicenantales bacterium]